MALPCYALEARDIGRLIRQFLEQENYRIEAQAMDFLDGAAGHGSRCHSARIGAAGAL